MSGWLSHSKPPEGTTRGTSRRLCLSMHAVYLAVSPSTGGSHVLAQMPMPRSHAASWAH